MIEVKNLSTLGITAGSESYGYVGYYAKRVYKEGENYLYTDENGYIIYDDGTDKILMGYTGTETDLTLPSGIPQIYKYAFSYCSKLTSITIPNSVTSIGSSAFSGCSKLTSITIPNSVTSIGSSAFYNCNSLTSVNITDIAAWCKISFVGYAANPLYYAHNLYLNNELVTELTAEDLQGVTNIGREAFYGCSSITSVTIGNSVTSIGERAFYECSSLTIYCEAASKPSGWDSSWNYSVRPVVWGWTGENYTYTFEANGGSELESITSNMRIILPTPTKDGWYFGGWYNNAGLTGSPVSSPYYSAANTALYAKWLTEEEYYDGSSFERAKQAESGGSYTVTIDAAGKKVYYKFTATESRSYTIKSGGGLDTYGYLYDSSKSQLTYNDGTTDFTITRTLTAGETYYVVVKMYSSSATGTFTLTIS